MMRQYILAMKWSRLVIFISLLSLQLHAQQDTTKKSTVTLAALYSSNVSYYGQSTNDPLPYVLLNATMRLPLGLYFSAGSYKLLHQGSGISEADLGIGFDRDFSDRFSMGTAYTRSFFPSNSPLLQASNQNNFNVSATYRWPFVKSEINADYAFGSQSDLFLSVDHSKEISLGSLFSDKNAFYIEPAIEVVAGTRHFYETYTISKEKRNKGKGKGSLSPGNPAVPTTTTSMVESDSFNLLSYNFKLPLSLSRSNYIAEISYQFSILGRKADAELKHQQSLFGAAFYYQF